jgi:hypothetical protein
MVLTQLVRRHLWSGPGPGPGALLRSEAVHTRAVLVVRLYYVVAVVWIAQSMPQWSALRKTTAIEPQWPAGWIERVGTSAGITAILAVYGAGAVAAMVAPHLRLARLAYTVGLLQFLAIQNGFGKVGHGFHAWWWVSAFLLLLPSSRRSWRSDATDDEREQFASTIVLAQLCVLFFFTLTGLWKLWHACVAAVGPGTSAFEVDGFSLLIAKNQLASGRDTVIGPLLIERPVLGWALFNATIYLEAASLLIVARPRLHRLWGYGLIAFHLGTDAAMGILFPASIVLVGLLLVASPFAPERLEVRATALDLPGVRFAARRWGEVERWRQGRAAAAPSPG